MADKEALEAALEVFRRKRAEIDVIIAGIMKELELPVDDNGENVAPLESTASRRVTLPGVTPGEFIGRKRGAQVAAILLGRTDRKPLTTEEISDLMQQSGYTPKKDLYTSLATSPALKLVVKKSKNETLWGLRKWYPAESKKKVKEKAQPEVEPQMKRTKGEKRAESN
ncbi:MAG: hypothetical protein NOU37_05925 [Candidatus Brocadiales bacterium]|nr:hypothetical protein [Candidatus Bathyanammoxibius amoris]